MCGRESDWQTGLCLASNLALIVWMTDGCVSSENVDPVLHGGFCNRMIDTLQKLSPRWRKPNRDLLWQGVPFYLFVFCLQRGRKGSHAGCWWIHPMDNGVPWPGGCLERVLDGEELGERYSNSRSHACWDFQESSLVLSLSSLIHPEV